MSENFNGHASVCERCQQYKPAQPATAAKCCLAGVILLKNDAAKTAPKKARASRPETWATKEQVKAAMRYK